MKQKIISITLILDALIIAIFCKRIEDFSVSNLELSWTISSILPKTLIIILSIAGVFWLSKLVKQKTTKVLIWIIPIVLFGIAFYSSPIYQGDYNRNGKTTKITQNQIIDSINTIHPDFNGLICIVSSTCPHCVDAAKRVKLFKKRSPELDIQFVIYSKDSIKTNHFKDMTDTKKFDYLVSENMNDIAPINFGSFPYFIYFKDNELIQRWQNEEMGYPALDWIENGLVE